MTRRVQNAVILDGRSAAMLWQAADLSSLRIRARSNEALYGVLVDIYTTALTWHERTTTEGKQTQVKREIRETQGIEIFTVPEVAERAGVTPRTVRNDIAKELIRATRIGREWIITRPDAEAYIAGRQRI